MPGAKKGDTVKVHYTGRFDDGSIFETTTGGEPLEFTIGEGQLIPGLEKAAIGMNPKESKTFKIPPEDAYGPYLKDLAIPANIKDLPPGSKPEIGEQFLYDLSGGDLVSVMVIDVSGDEVTLDANHPLAGQDLNFELRLIEIL